MGHRNTTGDVYHTELITPPWDGFPSSIARQPRGGDTCSESLGDMFPTPTFLCGTDTIIPTFEISSSWKIAQGGCDTHRTLTNIHTPRIDMLAMSSQQSISQISTRWFWAVNALPSSRWGPPFEIGGVVVAHVTEGNIRVMWYESYHSEDERHNFSKS